MSLTIVNGDDWLWSAANIRGANKDAKIYVGRSATLHNLLFCVYTLYVNYVANTFLLVSLKASCFPVRPSVYIVTQKRKIKMKELN